MRHLIPITTQCFKSSQEIIWGTFFQSPHNALNPEGNNLRDRISIITQRFKSPQEIIWWTLFQSPHKALSSHKTEYEGLCKSPQEIISWALFQSPLNDTDSHRRSEIEEVGHESKRPKALCDDWNKIPQELHFDRFYAHSGNHVRIGLRSLILILSGPSSGTRPE